MTLDIDRDIRRESFKRYALQCGLAGLVVLVLLLILDAVTQTVLIAALGLVLNEWDLLTLVVVMAGIVALSLIKRLVLPMLLDLI